MSCTNVEYLSFSWKYAFMAVNEAFRFAFASLCFDRAWNLMKFGIAIAARMPMIATTIISSMSVKPFCSFFIVVLLGLATAVQKQDMGRPVEDGNSGACAPRRTLVGYRGLAVG